MKIIQINKGNTKNLIEEWVTVMKSLTRNGW